MLSDWLGVSVAALGGSVVARQVTMEGTIPVFYPTMEEMGDFSAYISYMESCGAHEVGLAKVRSQPTLP